MELFSARVCPYAHRTRLTLIEKALPFEHIEIDLKNKPPDFLAVSPYGKVPAMVHEGTTVYESAIINEYLDEIHPVPPLMPSSPTLRAKARIWIDYCDDYFITDHYALLRNQDPAQHPALLAKSRRNLAFVETEGFGKLAGRGPYWLGSEPSLVDLAWYPFFERLPAWTHYRGLDLGPALPRLNSWLDAMSKRESVVGIANDAQYYVKHYVGYAKAVLRPEIAAG